MTDRVSSMQDYPAPLTVRRTFIEVEPAALRSPSLRVRLRRRARSCPPGDDVREALALVSPGPNRGSAPSRTSITFGSTSSYYTICASGCADNAVIDGWCNSSCGLPSGCVVALDLEPPTPATCTAASTAAPSSGYDSENEAIDEFCIADCSSESASSPAACSLTSGPPLKPGQLRLGSPELPTVGSAGHYVRRCKPCAFILKGCVSGIECRFCHLCEFDEKKRRRKVKRERLHEIHKQRQQQERRTITEASDC